MPKLTKRAVESARPNSDRDVISWDDGLPGFGLRISPTGRRSFIVQYRTRDGRSRRRVIGTFPVMTPDQARQLARAWLFEAQKGGDPAATMDKKRQAPTIADLCDRFLAGHAELHKKPQSVAEDRRIMDRYILPVLGRHKAAGVTAGDVERLHRKLKATPYQANRVLALLSSVLNQAENELRSVRPDWTNPTRSVRRFAEEKRRRYLSQTELAKLGEALTNAERQGLISRAAGAVIRLLILTGCRKGEILSLRWADVDFERARLCLSDSKTGQRDIHLSPPALEVLQRLERSETSPFVFPGRKPEMHLENVRKAWDAIRDAAELDGARIHDLRHSFASVGAGAGLSLPIIGALLGHSQAATTQRYAHLAADPLQQAADLIGRRISDAMGANKEHPGADQNPVRTRR